MMPRWIFLVVLCLLGWIPSVSGAEKRIALVIGNNAYEHARPLFNAANDAKLMKETLTKAGFVVTMLTDARNDKMLEAVDRFADLSRSADCALFFYAGHGVEVKGENFLIPVDCNPATETQFWYKALPLGRVISSLEANESKLSLIILDACRDNPFAQANTRSLGSPQGLAIPSTPTGSLIAYAADAGETASDSDGAGNGLYTGTLAKEMLVAGRRVEDVFYKTREIVETKSGGKQQPAEYNKLRATFYFMPESGAPLVAAPEPATPPLGEAATGGLSPEFLSYLVKGGQVRTALREYYSQVNSRNFDEAYALLSPRAQGIQSQAAHRDSFGNMVSVYVTKVIPTNVTDTEAIADTALTVVNSNQMRSVWEGDVKLVSENGSWRVDSTAGLRKVSEETLGALLRPLVVLVAEGYYYQLDQGDVEKAHSMLSKEYKEKLSLQTLGFVFDATAKAKVIDSRLVSSTEERAEVAMEVVLTDIADRESRWSGTMSLVNEDSAWRIDSMAMNEVNP